MDFGRLIRSALLASVLGCAVFSLAGTLQAETFPEFVDPNPAAGNQFGSTVVALSTGNVVITAPADDAGGTDAGAVYLFNGATGALISTLRGSTAGDNVGSFITALSNGNFVVSSQNWDNGAAANAGAVTWGSGTTGVSGVVSAANSLVGSTTGDFVGNFSAIALPNGNYVVRSTAWRNGAAMFAGAVTWGSGTAGVSGAVSAANSLVGSTASDQVGVDGVTVLSNGNFVVESEAWDNGAVADAGAATWGSGTAGVSGAVSAANSLVGSTFNDRVGTAVYALSNGNYVVASFVWDNGAVENVGAATWGSGTTGVSGAVSAANSLIGSTALDQVGAGGVAALSNGNYVVGSPQWDNGATANVGAATWCNGTTGVTGAVSGASSLIGSVGDAVGGGVTALSNGNYVVRSTQWNNGAATQAGAVTWGNGATGTTGVVSAANSLVGSTASDQVGSQGATALPNGNYLILSQLWDNGAVTNAGAVTWGSGTTGVSGAVSAANSLVGSTASDAVGGVVKVLSNGNYVVVSTAWNNGAVIDAGAATWGSGTTGVSGAISSANSLVGSTASDNVGNGSVAALSNGNYVVGSTLWNNGGIVDAGAATWGSGTAGVTGTISAANSLVGSAAGDNVPGGGAIALSNGNYVVRSPSWNNGAIADVGAATWGSGTTGVTGTISAANSLVGSKASDNIGVVTPLSNGHYVVSSQSWDNGALADAGAMTWGNGVGGTIGPVSADNSLVGAAAFANLQVLAVVDNVNNTFYGRFLSEGGGRVRVGPLHDAPAAIVSAVDIPNDQGGWLRLTFNRSPLDDTNGSPLVESYGVWRLVPSMLVARAEGTRYATGLGSRGPGINSAFPPGTWEQVANVHALQRAQYVVAIPTISNAEANDFVVTSHTTTPFIWSVSDPASGQSVDNLAPAEPTSLTGSYSSGQTNLAWAPNTENDLYSYRVYRGVSAGFTPGPGNQIAAPTSPGHADVGPAGSYYKVSATDVNGNESTFALITPDGTTGVGGGGAVAFALDGVSPNPANGNGLNVAFALPSDAPARLQLLDVGGRVVVAREVGSLGAGRHTVNLADGRSVAPGLYWVRLTQGPDRRKTRVTVIE